MRQNANGRADSSQRINQKRTVVTIRTGPEPTLLEIMAQFGFNLGKTLRVISEVLRSRMATSNAFSNASG